MNREERRKQARLVSKKYNLSFKDANEAVTLAQRPIIKLKEGVKVLLDYEAFKKCRDWNRFRKEYREFIEKNKDVTFTVEYDKDKVKNNAVDKEMFVCFKEDTTEPKWLFLTSYLIIAPVQDELEEVNIPME